MDPKELRGLVEAYKSVYAEVEQLDEMGQTRTTGQATAPKSAAAKPQPQMKGLSIGKGGFNVGGKPVKTGVSPIFQRPGAKPAAKPAPAAAKPAASGGTRPAAKPAPTPAAKPAPAAAKPAATSGTRPAALPSASKVEPAKPSSGSGYKKDTSVTDMIGRSQIRQGAPINTGNKSSDTRSMALRGTDVGGSGGSTAPKPAPTSTNKATGSKKPGSIVSGFDMFDVVKGHLIDEGYADTEEAALVIMANMSSEWRDSIIEAVKGESPERRKALAAERRKGIRPLSAKEGEKYASHKISQMSYTKRAKMGDDD